MVKNACTDAISAALGREPNEAELERIAEAVQARLKEKVEGGSSPRAAAAAVGAEIKAEAALKKARARFEAYKNILVKADLNLRMIPGNEIKAERSLLSGWSGSGERNAAASIDALRHTLRDNILNPMVNELEKLGLLKTFNRADKDFDLAVAKELKRRTDPTLGGPSGDARAAKVADVVGRAMDTMRAMMNKEGAFIGKVEGYMGRQFHDMWKIRDAGFAKWREGVMADRDVAKDFKGLTPERIQSQLQAEYKALSTGIHDSSEGIGQGGTYSVAAKVSQDRSINFKTAEGWYRYNEQFGKGSVRDAVYAAADAAGRDTALMRTLGTRPREMWDWFHNENLRAAIDRNDYKMVDKLKGQVNGSLFDMVTGTSDTPGRADLATIGANIRSVQQMLHLGMIMGSAVSHIPINALVLRHNGVPFLEALMGQVRQLFPQTAAAKEMAASVHAGLDGMFGHLIRRFHTEDGAPGHMAGAVNLFHKLNGFSYFMDAQKQGVGLALSHSLATNASKDFASLDARMQTSLRRYGIEEKEWDVGRASAQKAADGRNYLIPSAIEDARVSDKFQTFITDQIREGANEPTPYARNLAALGTRPGTWSGEVTRILSQFKSFAITMGERQWGRELQRNGFDKTGTLLLISSMTAFGLIGNALRGVATNSYMKTPKDAEGWVSLIKDSMLNGGALGLMGDMLARDGLKTGGDVLKTMLGPTAGTASDVIGAINKVREGSTAHDRLDLAKTGAFHVLGTDLTPNIWALQSAYDYMTPYAIQNLMHPGAIQRHNKVLRDNNKDWIVHP